MRSRDCGKDQGERRSGQLQWIFVAISIAVATTVSSGLVFLYIRHVRLNQTLHRNVVVLQRVSDPNRYFKGTVTFKETLRGKHSELSQDMYVDERNQEQVLHMAGGKMEVFVLQNFRENKQMAVMLLTNSTGDTGSVLVCDEKPLEGTYISKIHFHNINSSNVGDEVTVTESFEPADQYMSFQYRSCDDIPRNLFRNRHTSTNTDERSTVAHNVKRSAAKTYGSWCGPRKRSTCCNGCNADYANCVSSSCRPLLDPVDKACFTYQMCEECSGLTNGIPSCSCIKDFMADLQEARCSYSIAELKPDSGTANYPSMVVTRKSVVLGQGPVSVGSLDTVPNVIILGVTPKLHIKATDVLASTAKQSSANSVAVPSKIDRLLAETKTTLLANQKPTATGVKGRLKRNVKRIKMRFQAYNRKSCFQYRGQIMMELVNQKCWCPIFIRVKYICGYQQVPDSCSDKGKKCAFKYKICTKIMSGKKLNAVGYKNCPSVP